MPAGEDRSSQFLKCDFTPTGCDPGYLFHDAFATVHLVNRLPSVQCIPFQFHFMRIGVLF